MAILSSAPIIYIFFFISLRNFRNLHHRNGALILRDILFQRATALDRKPLPDILDADAVMLLLFRCHAAADAVIRDRNADAAFDFLCVNLYKAGAVAPRQHAVFDRIFHDRLDRQRRYHEILHLKLVDQVDIHICTGFFQLDILFDML